MSARENIEQTIAAIEARRAAIGDTLADAAIAPLRRQLSARPVKPTRSAKRTVTIRRSTTRSVMGGV